MSNLQKYGEWTAEEATKDAEDLAALGSGAEFLKFKTGKNQLRFLPPRPGEKPFVLVQQHFIDVPGTAGKSVVFVCPRVHAKKHCSACQQADVLRATGSPVDYERAGKLLPRLRVFANVIDRADPEAGVRVAAFGKQVYEQLIALRKNEEAGGNFTDPSPAGFDIIIEKSGEGMKTEYKVFPARKNSALGNEDWLDAMHDLRRYARVPSEEEMARMLGGSARGSTVGQSAPTGRGGRGASKGRTAADDVIETDGEVVD